MSTQNPNPIIKIRDLTKRFGGLTAVNRVDLDIFPAEVTALVGANGAGKSTLIQMISGFHKPTDGEIFFKEGPLPLGNPLAVNKLGIETVYQDQSLAELLSPPENVFLGREKCNRIMGLKILDNAFMREETQKVLKRLNVDFPSMTRPIRFFSGGQRQSVCISRALYWDADVIIMDEPTAALGIREKRQVMDLILDLKSEGVTVIVISHEMHDVFEIADKIVVLFQGNLIAVKEKHKTTIDEIASLIIAGKDNAETVRYAV